MTREAILAELGGGHDAVRVLLDPLTGLPNRVLFADRLQMALARAARSGGKGRKAPRMVALLVDLDGFAAVNAALGQAAGDAVLEEVGRRLTFQVRDSDTVARLGDDEFVVLLEGVQASDGGAGLARRLAAALAEPYAVVDEPARVSAAVGLAVAEPAREDGAMLLRRADGALRAAKQAGPGRVAVASAP